MPTVASYWAKKALNAHFHPETWGGARANTYAFGMFSNDVVVQAVVWMAVDAHPGASFSELLDLLHRVPGLQGFVLFCF